VRFDEFHAGQRIRVGPKRISEEEILAFARAYDPQWFHTDPERARNGRWNGLIASGWHTGAIAMRMVVEELLKDSESIGSPGLNYLKWRAPVRPADELTLEVSVLDASPSGSGRVGVLRWRWQLYNQRGEEVLDTEATSLFDLSSKPGAG
jgi:acyl dehydratase